MFVSKCRGHQLHAFIDLGTEIKYMYTPCNLIEIHFEMCIFFFYHSEHIEADQLYLNVNAFCQEKGYHAGR